MQKTQKKDGILESYKTQLSRLQKRKQMFVQDNIQLEPYREGSTYIREKIQYNDITILNIHNGIKELKRKIKHIESNQ